MQTLNLRALIPLRTDFDAILILLGHLLTNLLGVLLFGEPKKVLYFAVVDTVEAAGSLASGVSRLKPMQQLRKLASSAANKALLDGSEFTSICLTLSNTAI